MAEVVLSGEGSDYFKVVVEGAGSMEFCVVEGQLWGYNFEFVEGGFGPVLRRAIKEIEARGYEQAFMMEPPEDMLTVKKYLKHKKWSLAMITLRREF